ncbi:MAG: sigma-54 dependent transcriptional regulator [Deltaproteobacteria bacterium]
MRKILVVDDEPEMRFALKEALTRKGYSVELANDGADALEKVSDSGYGMVISDMRMPGAGGMDVLKGVKKADPNTPVLLVTAFGTVEKAVEAVKLGAVDFILKPFTLEALEMTVDKAFRDAEAITDFETNGKAMVSKGSAMSKVLSLAMVAATSDATVLISGESGTGKEMLSRFIHSRGPRANRPFVAVNCACIPDGLLESELFGHEKGAFTGAASQRLGKFEQADRGTLLLDEVSEMDLRLQAKLLRVVQEREVERLGGKAPVPVDIRIIATTNREMKKEIKDGRFREDLFYRLNIFPLTLPPLRERTEDLGLLAEHFMRRFSAKYSRGLVGISAEAIEYIQRYPWPGNIRELENTIERAVLVSSGDMFMLEIDGLLMGQDLEGSMEPCAPSAPKARSDRSVKAMTLREMEKGLICRTLDDVEGNRTRAAGILGISVRTLRNKLKEYGQNMPV